MLEIYAAEKDHGKWKSFSSYIQNKRKKKQEKESISITAQIWGPLYSSWSGGLPYWALLFCYAKPESSQPRFPTCLPLGSVPGSSEENGSSPAWNITMFCLHAWQGSRTVSNVAVLWVCMLHCSGPGQVEGKVRKSGFKRGYLKIKMGKGGFKRGYLKKKMGKQDKQSLCKGCTAAFPLMLSQCTNYKTTSFSFCFKKDFALSSHRSKLVII